MPKTEFDIIFQQINSLQSKKSDFFLSRMFSSFRSNAFWLYRRPDSNIFATASTLFILNEIKPFCSPSQQSMIADWYEKGLEVFTHFKNKDGLETYNFWQTKPTNHFPNGYVFRHFKHFKLPDDIDDTALIYFLQKRSPQEVEKLRDKIILHSKPYVNGQDYAYNTWFGKNMPLENDLCALSNLMNLVLQSGIELLPQDIATLNFLSKNIKDGTYLTRPFEVSRHYGNAALIIYHLVRLISSNSYSEFEKIKMPLKHQAQKLFEEEKNTMNKVLLHTSLLKLGHKAVLAVELRDIETEKFFPFIGAPFAPFSGKLFQKLANKPWLIINWECEALKLAYYLENRVLAQKPESKN